MSDEQGPGWLIKGMAEVMAAAALPSCIPCGGLGFWPCAEHTTLDAITDTEARIALFRARQAPPTPPAPEKPEPAPDHEFQRLGPHGESWSNDCNSVTAYNPRDGSITTICGLPRHAHPLDLDYRPEPAPITDHPFVACSPSYPARVQNECQWHVPGMFGLCSAPADRHHPKP